MARVGYVYIVSNGDQTDTISGALRSGLVFGNAMQRRVYEPDAPNFTPRISGVCSPRSPTLAEIAILKRSEWGDDCIRSFHRYDELPAGFGYCVTTYLGDGNPLPAFRGEPYLLPLFGNMSAIMTDLWASLNEANRVSLAVRFIHRETGNSQFGVTNKYTKVAQASSV